MGHTGFSILLSITPIALIMQSGYVLSSSETAPSGARSAGLGNTAVMHRDIWSVWNNQAGLTGLTAPTAGIAYENRYLLPELGLKGGVIAVPSKYGVFSASASVFGYTLYSEKRAGIAYARPFGEGFSAGMQFNYLGIQMGDVYGTKNLLVVEAGVQAKLTKYMMLGAHIFNPARAQIATYNDERVPALMRIGLDYRFSEKVLVCAEAEKDIDHKPVFKAGIEYLPVEILYVRAGIATNPSVTSFGIGLNMKRLKIDLASGYHTVLGYTPQLAISYSLK